METYIYIALQWTRSASKHGLNEIFLLVCSHCSGDLETETWVRGHYGTVQRGKLHIFTQTLKLIVEDMVLSKLCTIPSSPLVQRCFFLLLFLRFVQHVMFFFHSLYVMFMTRRRIPIIEVRWCHNNSLLKRVQLNGDYSIRQQGVLLLNEDHNPNFALAGLFKRSTCS